MLPDIGFETHIVQVAVKRNVFNSQTAPGMTNIMAQPEDDDDAYGPNAKLGAEVHLSMPQESTASGNELEYCLNVLYEFGEKQYIVQRDGQMLPGDSYPDIKINENLTGGQDTYGQQDPRKKSSGGRMGRLRGENEFNRQ